LDSTSLRLKRGESQKKDDAKSEETQGRRRSIDLLRGSGKLGNGRVAETLAHVTATPFRMHFDILIECVENIKDSAGAVTVVYERKDKLFGTKVCKVVGKKVEYMETISVEATLYRRGKVESATGFDKKLVKFAVRMEKLSGRTIGKIHVDLAEHARVPAGSVPAIFTLSNGSVLRLRFDSRLVSSGRRNKGDDGSSLGGGSMYSDEPGDMQSDGTGVDDLDTLSDCLDEIGSVKADEKKPSKSTGRSLEPTMPSPRKPSTTENASLSSVRSEQSRMKRQISDLSVASANLNRKLSSLGIEEVTKDDFNAKRLAQLTDQKNSLSEEIESLKERLRKLQVELERLYEDTDDAAKKLAAQRQRGTRVAMDQGDLDDEDIEEIERLEDEIEELQEEQDELRRRSDELVSQLSSQVSGSSSQATNANESRRKKEDERRQLQSEVSQLRAKLVRDQRFLAVVNDLKEVKMALALTNMEKEEATLELRRLQQHFGLRPTQGAAKNFRSYGGYGGF